MGVKSKAKVFDSEYNIQPGIDDKLRVADSKVWKVDMEFLTGAKFYDLGHFSGPQVGPGADGDAMGEESHEKITYQGGGRGKYRKGKH
jgi:hypothetical protein